MAQWPRDASGGLLGVPWPYPGADSFLKMPDDLGSDAAVDVFPFGRVWHGLLLKEQLFSSRNPRRFGGVQRRGPVKGAALSRVHRRPLTGSTAGLTPVLEGAGEAGKKVEKETFGCEHRWKVFGAGREKCGE